MSPSVRLEDMTVLLVDDEPANVALLQQILKRYDFTDVHATTDPRQVAGMVTEVQADLVVLDLNMPHLDGYGLLTLLRDEVVPRGTYLPRLVVTADVSPLTRRKALNLNAHDFLTKPIDAVETFLRIRNLLQTRRLHLELEGANTSLEARVQARTAELEQTVLGAVQALVDTLALASPVAFSRAARTGTLVRALSDDLGVADRWTELLPVLAQLGAVSLPEEVLERAAGGAELSHADREMLDRVPTTSARLLPDLPQLAGLREAVRLQGARFDDRGDALPLGARLLRAASDLDAALAQGLPPAVAVDALAEDAGAYDPEVLAALRRHLSHEQAHGTRRVEVADLEPGMVLAQDVHACDGRLLVGRGTAVTDGLVERLRNYAVVRGLATGLSVVDDGG